MYKHLHNSLLFFIALLIIHPVLKAQTSFDQKAENRKPAKANHQPSLKNVKRINALKKTNRTINQHARFKTLTILPEAAQKSLKKLQNQDANLKVSFSTKNGTPHFITGSKVLHAKKLEKASNVAKTAAAYDFLEKNKALLFLKNPQEEFSVRKMETNELGKTFIRLDQLHKGIPVWLSDVVIHLNDEGVATFNGRYHPTPKLENVTPDLAGDQAIAIVAAHLGQTHTIREFTALESSLLQHNERRATLVIFPNESGTQCSLVWHVTFFPNIVDRWEYFVDAHTGEIHQFYNHTCTAGPETATATDLKGIDRTIHTYELGGTYYMLDTQRPMYNGATSDLPDDPVGGIVTLNLNNQPVEATSSSLSHNTSATNNWSNPTAVSAHYNARLCYDYFRVTHSRNSLNGSGSSIYSIINIADGDGGPLENAFWNGYFMGYGNGGTAFSPLAEADDVAAHEMSHAVTQNTANLAYQFQSGALNESFSDIFGAMVDRDDWKMGEDVVNPAIFPSGALRDLSNPNNGGSFGDPYWQPATMSEYRNLSFNVDNGGVHINSGIPNYAYYLYATDIGKDKAERVYYTALTEYLTQSSQFLDCRLAVIQSAEDLFGEGSAEAAAACMAFNMVGILDGSSDCTGSGGGGTPGSSTSYETELPPVEGDEHLLLHGLADDTFSIYDGSFVTGNLTPLLTLPAKRKPSVDDSGEFCVFVGTDDHIYIVDLNASTPTAEQLSDYPEWNSVAISRDGNRLALVANEIDHTIYIFDFIGQAIQPFELYNPSTVEGFNGGEPLFADFIEFDPTGELVMYDAFNQLGIGSSGQPTGYWDVGLINVWDNNTNDFGDGTIFKIFPSLPEGISVGNASFSKNSPHIIAFDYLNNFAGTQSLRAANLESGEVGTIFTTLVLGTPNYSTDDDFLVFTAISSYGDTVIANIPLAADKINAGGDPEIMLEFAKWPIWYAKGERAFSVPNANFSANITDGAAPLTVNFFDESNNIPTQWNWTFEGGSPATSNEPNPIVTFENQGFYTVTLNVNNPAGSDIESKDSYIIIFSTGIEDNTALNAIHLYPNPTEGIFTMDVALHQADKLNIRIFDSVGALVYSEDTPTVQNLQQTIDLSEHPAGLYMVQVETGGKMQTFKMMVK